MLVAPVVRLHHVVTGMSVRRSCVSSASCQTTVPAGNVLEEVFHGVVRRSTCLTPVAAAGTVGQTHVALHVTCSTSKLNNNTERQSGV